MMMGSVRTVSLLFPAASFIQMLKVAVSFLAQRGRRATAYWKVRVISPSKLLVRGTSEGTRYRSESAKFEEGQRVVIFLTQMVSRKSPCLSVSLMVS